MGFPVRLGDTVGMRDFTFAGTDEQRAKDFQNMIDDDSIKASHAGTRRLRSSKNY